MSSAHRIGTESVASESLRNVARSLSEQKAQSIQASYSKPEEDSFLMPGLHLVPFTGSYRDSVMSFTPAIRNYLKSYWESNSRFSETPQYVFLKAGKFEEQEANYSCFQNARQNNIRFDSLQVDAIKSFEDIIKMPTNQFLASVMLPEQDYVVRGVFFINPHELIKDRNEDLFKALIYAMDRLSRHRQIPFYFLVDHSALRDIKLRRLYHRRTFAKTLGYNF